MTFLSNRWTPRAVAVVAALVAVGLWSTAIIATQTETGKDVNVTSPVTDDLMTAGQNVRVEGEVAGDAAVAGSDVTLDGPVRGYFLGAGRTLTFDGPIGNDLWAAGERVDVTSHVSNNAMIAGREIHLRPEALIGHDAHLAGNTVVTEGRIENNLRIGAGTARVGGNIGGTVRADAGRVTVLPGTVIAGDLVVRANQPPDVSPQAKVLGQVRYEEIQRRGWFAWPWVWTVLFLSLWILGFAALTLSSSWPVRAARTMTQRIGSSILVGLGLLILLPIAIVLLAVTVIGIPLAVVLAALYVAALVLSTTVVAYWIGSWVMEHMHRPNASSWARMGLGALIVSFGISLPMAGWLVAIAVLIVGAGSLVLEWRDEEQQMRAI